MIPFTHPAAEALYQAAVAPGGDPVACLLLADLIDEAGDSVTAAGWRWLGRNHEVMHNDTDDEEDPWARCVYVCVELLPGVVRHYLPVPVVDRQPEDVGQAQRIIPDLWVDREAFVTDFLAAWRQAHAEPEEVFQLQSD